MKIADVNCYVATPKGEYAQDKAILYIPDVFGIQLLNHKVRPHRVLQITAR